ncbi:aKG-HExxH-type peptide beta-hydroxylase [Mesorhizobium sp. LjRoot246]|uniref:aKG-HExxH-type peptide beta-hydroxylase n=1 Tax=Mesorhizobium sp. LjRoot246 TaxID=3342294 RepID=UPI003ECD6DA5
MQASSRSTKSHATFEPVSGGRTWVPDAARAIEEQYALFTLVEQAIVDIVRAAAPEAIEQVKETFAHGAKVSGALLGSPSALFHPSFFVWYSDFANAVRDDDWDHFLKILETLPSILERIEKSIERSRKNHAQIGFPVDLLQEPDDSRSAAKRLAQSAENTVAAVNEKAEPVRIVDAPSARLMEQLSKSYALVKSVWPEMADEMAIATRRIVFLDTSQIIGASDGDCLGTIFIGMKETQVVSKLAEEIIHETSHNVLNTLALASPIIENDASERHFSPLRVDLRPVFGIVHQVFVLSRLVEFYRRLKKKEPRFEVQFGDVLTRFTGGVDVVEQYARAAPAGGPLLRSFTQYRAQVVMEACHV